MKPTSVTRRCVSTSRSIAQIGAGFLRHSGPSHRIGALRLLDCLRAEGGLTVAKRRKSLQANAIETSLSLRLREGSFGSCFFRFQGCRIVGWDVVASWRRVVYLRRTPSIRALGTKTCTHEGLPLGFPTGSVAYMSRHAEPFFRVGSGTLKNWKVMFASNSCARALRIRKHNEHQEKATSANLVLPGSSPPHRRSPNPNPSALSGSGTGCQTALLAHLLVNLLVVRHCGVESHLGGLSFLIYAATKLGPDF